MEALLAQGIPADRAMEKTARAWLARCHEQLDKTTCFEQLLPAAEQAALRRQFGEGTTFFASMTDGERTIAVRCRSFRPALAQTWHQHWCTHTRTFETRVC